MVSSICTASSRVGARISARVVLARRLVPSAMIFDRIGSAKAAVLPEPVWAMPKMSRPSSCGGIAWTWIGFGSVKPAAWVALSSAPEIPSAAKPVSSAVLPADVVLPAKVFSLVKIVFFHAALAANIDAAGRNLPSKKLI